MSDSQIAALIVTLLLALSVNAWSTLRLKRPAKQRA